MSKILKSIAPPGRKEDRRSKAKIFRKKNGIFNAIEFVDLFKNIELYGNNQKQTKNEFKTRHQHNLKSATIVQFITNEILILSTTIISAMLPAQNVKFPRNKSK